MDPNTRVKILGVVSAAETVVLDLGRGKQPDNLVTKGALVTFRERAEKIPQNLWALIGLKMPADDLTADQLRTHMEQVAKDGRELIAHTFGGLIEA